MAAAGFALGVDFGTSNTVAMLRWPDGRARPLLVDGSPLQPSSGYADPTYFTNVLGRQVPIGSVVVVHDFGAGTFDVSVVARTGNGFDVLAVDGRDDVGGLDIDAAIVTHLGQRYGATPEWQRLTSPS